MRPAKIWLITDTHWNHKMLVDEGHRPADFEAQIAKNWRKAVMLQDTVIHLGDVIMARSSELFEILTTLPGKKILVRGNHDRESDGWYERNGFSFVAQGILIGGVWLTHAPQVTLPDGAILNVHGHLHAGTHRTMPVAEHCRLFSLEKEGYGPIDFDEFVGFTPMRKRILMPYEVEGQMPKIAVPANKYNHAEAFCLMQYSSDDGTEREVLWNSRDGVTPFVISSRNGKKMAHVDWRQDKYVPDYKPKSGMRVFVDATEELVTDKLNEYVDKIFAEHGGGYWPTKEDAFKALLPGWLHEGEAPWIVVTP